MRRRVTPNVLLAVVTVTMLVLVAIDDEIGPVGIVVGVVVATAGLFALVELEHLGQRTDVRLVAGAAAIVLGAAVVVAPHDSHDLWSYTMYGRILSVHGASPWTVTPAHYPSDPMLHLVARGWRHTTSIYGPAFELVAALVTRIGGDAATVVRMLFTGTFAIAAAGAGALVYRRTASPAALALVTLHPAIAVAGIAGGHNDIFVGLGLVAAVLLAQDDRPVASGVAVALGSLVKLTGLIGLLAIGAWALAHHGRRWAGRFAATAGGLVVLAYLPFGTSGLSAFAHNRGSLSRASAWELPRLLTGLDHRHAALNLGLPRSDTELLISLGALMTAAITIAIAWRLRRGPVAVALTAALGSYLVFAPYVLPWYPAWVIPVIGLAPRVPVTRVLTFQAALLVIVYELKTQDLTTQLANIVWWIAVIASVTLCVLFLRSLRRVPAANRELSAVGAR
ncbi:MAG: glycosyltransferase family 87 protein [Acidimicrobiia bacterium]